MKTNWYPRWDFCRSQNIVSPPLDYFDLVILNAKSISIATINQRALQGRSTFLLSANAMEENVVPRKSEHIDPCETSGKSPAYQSLRLP